MNLVQMIDFWALHKPESPAIIMLDQVVSYQLLSRATRSVAAHLARRRIDPVEPVGILIDNPPHNVAVTLALMSLGIPSVVIRNDQVDRLAAIGARTLVCDEPPASPLGMQTLRIEPGWFADPNPPPPVRVGKAARIKLAFTSGTTGVPKAIAFSNDDIAARSNFLRMMTGDIPWTRSLIMPGLSTNFAFSQVALALETGRTISFGASPGDIGTLIEFFGIELLICSNLQAQGLVDHLEGRKLRLRALKGVCIAGAVLAEDLVRKIKEYLCREVIGFYASTEAHVAAFARWDAMKHTPRAVGFVCPWARIECLDETGTARPPGQDGEIRIRTPNQGLHYAPGGDIEGPVESWFYPGDRGFVTAEGLLVITGRTTDTINKGGVKISAAVLDQCLASLPGIEDAAVCTLPGGAGPDELVAVVVSTSQVDLPALNAALERARIEATIDRFMTVGQIPRNATGKVNRADLRALAQGRLTS